MNRAQRKYLLNLIHKKRIERREASFNKCFRDIHNKIMSQWEKHWEDKEWEYVLKQGNYLLELDRRYW